MRIQFKLFLALLTAVTLIFGTTGCRSNKTGAWYSPKSYSFYNPFKKTEADEYRKGTNAQAGSTSKPSLESQPNVSVPPGGYAHPAKESDFFAGENQKYGQKAVQTQYGYTGGETAVVAANPYSVPNNETDVTGYSAPSNGTVPYNPYNARPYSATEPATLSGFQQTRYYEPQNNLSAVPAGIQQPALPQYPQPNPVVPTAPNAADVSPVYGNPIVNPAAPSNAPVAQPQTYYAPNYPAAPIAPYSNASATYGTPAATPAETAPQGVVPQTAAPAGYTANPSSYQPNTGTF